MKEPVQLIVAAFPTTEGATNAMTKLSTAKKEGLIGIEDMAIVVKDESGKLKITDSKHHTAKGLVTGGVIGGLVGLLAGPVGWAAMGGGALGVLAGKIRGLPIKAELKSLGESLVPNSSAIVAIIEHTWVNDFQRMLVDAGARVVQDTFKEDITRELTAGGNVLYSLAASEQGAAAMRASSSSQGKKVAGIVASGDTLAGGRMTSDDEGFFVENATFTNEKIETPAHR